MGLLRGELCFTRLLLGCVGLIKTPCQSEEEDDEAGKASPRIEESFGWYERRRSIEGNVKLSDSDGRCL